MQFDTASGLSERRIVTPVEPEPNLHPVTSMRRGVALRAWVDGQVTLKDEIVELPVSQRRYIVHLPTSEAREALFEQARADPEKQLPFWADVWPSGLALADIALERRADLAGQRVIELGSGLGITALATSEVEGRVLAVDYSPLALAICRYNALCNLGDSPRTIAVNWRTMSRHVQARLEANGPVPIVMAADVLYESRDIEPLIALIERLLAPDGMLWLAEPGRKVARRFLDTLAMAGWRCTSRHFDGPWHGRQTGRVSVHFLRRPSTLSTFHSTIGGWRI